MIGKKRMQAYTDLIQALLTCDDGEELKLLQYHEDLVDSGLVDAMFLVANQLEKDENNLSRWLIELAKELEKITKKSADSESKKEEDDDLEKWMNEFPKKLRAILEQSIYPADNTVSQSNFFFVAELLASTLIMNDSDRNTHSLLKNNKSRINEKFFKDFLPIIHSMIDSKEAEVKSIIVSAIGLLAYSIRQLLPNNSLNMELAICAYETVKENLHFHEDAERWAENLHCMASAYSERFRGDRADNLEKAITYYRDSLKVRTESDFPLEWASTQSNLATAFAQRIHGNHSSNLEEAIICAQNSLKIRTESDFPLEWASTQSNLINILRERVHGDRLSNLEEAITCAQNSLKIYTEEGFPDDWARVQLNLANVLREQNSGGDSDNIEKSITCYQSALRVYHREAFPIDWALIQLNLATAFSERIEGDHSSNLEKAIILAQNALRIYTEKDFPFEWAMTQHNLATIFSERIEGDHSSNLEKAIILAQNALRIYTEKDFPFEWAMTQYSLGGIYDKRVRGKRETNLKRAIAAYNLAAHVYTVETDPHQCRMVYYELGNLHFTLGNWTQAFRTYGVCLDANDRISTWANSDDRRQDLKNEVVNIYNNLIQSHINLGQFTKALETVERSRSQRLVNLMATNDLYHGQIPAEIQTYLQQIDQLQARIDRLCGLSSPNNVGEATLATSNRTVQVQTARDRNKLTEDIQEIHDLEQQKQKLQQQLSHRDPETAALLQVSAPNLAAIQTLLACTDKGSKTALLSFYTTDEATHIFVLKPDQTVTCHTCPDQTVDSLHNWLIDEWLNPYSIASALSSSNKENEHERETEREEGRRLYAAWLMNMPDLLTEIAQRLQIDQLITDHLGDIDELILIPHLFLHQIPFAALPTTDGLLGNHFHLRTVPSTQILEFCQNRPNQPITQYASVEDATEDLPCSNYEGQQIANLHNIPDQNRLRGRNQATIDNYRQLLQDTHHLLSSHHAQSRLDNPLESCLLLADGTITLGQLLTPGWRLPQLSDVFLSCCETGVGFKPSVADEPLSLATGFLCAGARNVVSTLWSVDDLATALFSIRYHHHRQNENRPAALQLAQQDLRTMTGQQLKQTYAKDLNALLDDRYDHAETQRAQIAQQLQTGRFTEERYNALKKEQDHWAIAATKIDNTQDRLKKHCREDHPFAHPIYWAGFVSQGIR